MESLIRKFQDFRIHHQTDAYQRRENTPRGFRLDRHAAGIQSYTDVLKGLGKFFDYVRTLDNRTILDVGTGKGYALREFRNSGYGYGLCFQGTGLVAYPETIENLGEDNFFATPGEFLEGVPDMSVGGITAVYSIANSKSGSRVAERFDEVLGEGGVIKANFFRDDLTYYLFIRELKKRGYTIATAFKPHSTETLPHPSFLVIAIKPQRNPDKFTITAQELLQQDLDDCERQNLYLLNHV